MVYDYFVGSFQIFLMVFARLMGIFVTVPFFSGLAMPVRMRLGFAFFVSLMVVPLVVAAGIQAPANIVDFGARLLGNFVFGAGIGFFIYVVIVSFQVSAQIFSIPMGLGMNEVVDPMSQIQVPALGNILGIMILFLLIRIDGHFYFVQLIVDSFAKVELIQQSTIGLLTQGLVSSLVTMFQTALKIALPIISITLMMDMAMGMISRVAPQFNVMIMGFNIKILAGFLVIFMALPILINLGTMVINGILNNARDLLVYMKGAG